MPVFESSVKMWQQLIGGWADSCAQVDLSILPSSLPSRPPKLFTLPTISQPSSPSPLCPAHPLGLSFSLVPTFSGRGGNDVTDCPSAFTPHCWLSTIVPLVLSLYRALPGPLLVALWVSLTTEPRKSLCTVPMAMCCQLSPSYTVSELDQDSLRDPGLLRSDTQCHLVRFGDFGDTMDE